MAHIIDIMLSVASQINAITRKYNNKSSILNCEIPETPLFVAIAMDRCIQKNEDCIIDSKASPMVVTDIVAKFNTGDIFSPVYAVVANNINGVMFDKFPLQISQQDVSGTGIGKLIIIPERIFTDDEDEFYYVIGRIFIDIYKKLIGTDENMIYDGDIEFTDIIKYSENPKVKIPTYDIEMVVIALACAYINLREMYNNIDASFLLDSIEEEIPLDIKNNIIDALNNLITSVASLRESIANGSLIAQALGYDDKI